MEFTGELRGKVRKLIAEMHTLFDRGHTPKIKATKACNACSLKDICIPKLSRTGSVVHYLSKAMENIE